MEVVAELIRAGASVGCVEDEKFCPLGFVVEGGHGEVVKELLFAEAAVDGVRFCGYAP